MNEWFFFDIGLRTLNLFSFMLGATWAFFNQGLFGKRIGTAIFIYFAGLAFVYGVQFYAQVEVNKKLNQVEQVKVVPDPNKDLNNEQHAK